MADYATHPDSKYGNKHPAQKGNTELQEYTVKYKD